MIVADQITFENGAKVKCNFASNLYGDKIITTAPLLNEYITACESQNQKVNIAKYRYPDEVLDVSAVQTICRGGIDWSLSRSECVIIRDLDRHPKRGGLFGDHFLMSVAKGAEKEAARQAVPIELSPRERRIVERLGRTSATS